MIRLATGTASCIGQGNVDGLSVTAASAFITRLIDVILSEAKNLGLFPDTFAQKWTEMLRSAQHDSAIISRSPAFGLFLRSNRAFQKARRVGVGEIRRILVGLIEHFSSAARISAVLLDQRRD